MTKIVRRLMPPDDQTADKARKHRNLLKGRMIDVISAYCVRTDCKFGYLRLCKRPHLQTVLPCLAGFSSACQDLNPYLSFSKSEAGCLHSGQMKSAGRTSPSYT